MGNTSRNALETSSPPSSKRRLGRSRSNQRSEERASGRKVPSARTKPTSASRLRSVTGTGQYSRPLVAATDSSKVACALAPSKRMSVTSWTRTWQRAPSKRGPRSAPSASTEAGSRCHDRYAKRGWTTAITTRSPSCTTGYCSPISREISRRRAGSGRPDRSVSPGGFMVRAGAAAPLRLAVPSTASCVKAHPARARPPRGGARGAHAETRTRRAAARRERSRSVVARSARATGASARPHPDAHRRAPAARPPRGRRRGGHRGERRHGARHRRRGHRRRRARTRGRDRDGRGRCAARRGGRARADRGARRAGGSTHRGRRRRGARGRGGV